MRVPFFRDGVGLFTKIRCLGVSLASILSQRSPGSVSGSWSASFPGPLAKICTGAALERVNSSIHWWEMR